MRCIYDYFGFSLLQLNRDQLQELIDYIDEDGDGLIDAFDWTTRLTDALNYEFEKPVNTFKVS